MEFLVGLESGIGVEGARPDYAECLCDDVAHGPEAPQISAGKPAASEIHCPAKCPGAEPGGADQCGGAPGTWALSVYRVNCGVVWGFAFLITFMVGCFLYMSGGIYWNVKLHGVRPELRAHPHFAQWAQIAGLVQDGVQYSRAQLKKEGAGSTKSEAAALHAPLSVTADSCGRGEDKDHREDVHHSDKALGSCSDDTDDLVE